MYTSDGEAIGSAGTCSGKGWAGTYCIDVERGGGSPATLKICREGTYAAGKCDN